MSITQLPKSDVDKKSVSILGVTGSVGRSCLAVIASRPQDFDLHTIYSTGRSPGDLARIAEKHAPQNIVISQPQYLDELKQMLEGSGIKIYAGMSALRDLVAADVVIAAVGGFAGLEPTSIAIESGSNIALANKESIVCGSGHLKRLAAVNGVTILPLDSEHSAIHQAMRSGRRCEIEHITLTASGGPFRTWSKKRIAAASKADALAHPVWKMGQKLSIDSATMMNKGLEIIEASYLFDIDESRISALIHPQTIIHSMVTFRDGSSIAQLSPPDMRGPIAYCLDYPDRRANSLPRLSLSETRRLDFQPIPDPKFPCLGLARLALKAGPDACLVLNCANEIATSEFLAQRIAFYDIASIIERSLDLARSTAASTLDEILDREIEVRANINEKFLKGPA